MTLSEFINLTQAWEESPGHWKVNVTLNDGTPEGTDTVLNVDQCHSEFEAKERSFLYLLNAVHNRK